MEVNKAQKQGRLGITIGNSGANGTYATLNGMARTIESIVGPMSKGQAFHAMRSNEER